MYTYAYVFLYIFVSITYAAHALSVYSSQKEYDTHSAILCFIYIIIAIICYMMHHHND